MHALRHIAQSSLASFTLALALAGTVAAWLLGRPGMPSGEDILLACCLAGAMVAAFRFPIRLRPDSHVSMTSVPVYLMAVMLPLPLAMAGIGLGTLAGALSIRRRTGNYISDIVVQVGRTMLVGGAGSFTAHLVSPHIPALLSAAGVLWGAEMLTSPLLFFGLTGQGPLDIIRSSVRGAGSIEAAQQLMGVLGALAASQSPWAISLLVLPVVLVYVSFRTARDMHERTRRLLLHVVETSPECILVLAPDGTITTANRQAAGIFGFERPESMLGMNLAQLAAPDAADRVRTDIYTFVQQRQRTKGEYQLQHSDGHQFLGEMTWSVVEDRQGTVTGVTCLVRDLTETQEVKSSLQYRALHDALTDLPNRLLFQQRLEHAITLAREDSTSLSVLLIDLDGFKLVNDTYGHHHGDVLLCRVADRLRRVLRTSDTVARLGGDEFAVLLPGTATAGAEVVGSKILAALKVPIVIEGVTCRVGGSIGGAQYPEHGLEPSTLLHCADMAMYAAKRSKTGYVTYGPDIPESGRPTVPTDNGFNTSPFAHSLFWGGIHGPATRNELSARNHRLSERR